MNDDDDESMIMNKWSMNDDGWWMNQWWMKWMINRMMMNDEWMNGYDDMI